MQCEKIVKYKANNWFANIEGEKEIIRRTTTYFAWMRNK